MEGKGGKARGETEEGMSLTKEAMIIKIYLEKGGVWNGEAWVKDLAKSLNLKVSTPPTNAWLQV